MTEIPKLCLFLGPILHSYEHRRFIIRKPLAHNILLLNCRRFVILSEASSKFALELTGFRLSNDLKPSMPMYLQVGRQMAMFLLLIVYNCAPARRYVDRPRIGNLAADPHLSFYIQYLKDGLLTGRQKAVSLLTYNYEYQCNSRAAF